MRRLLAPAALPGLLLALGCPPAPTPTPTPAPNGVVLDADTGALVLWRGGVERMRLAAGGLQLGEVELLEADRRSFDPYFLGQDLPLVDEVEWRSITGVEPTEGGAALTFEGGATARLDIDRGAELLGRTALTLTPTSAPRPLAYVRLRATVDAAEGFYGLGSALDTPNHRGLVRAMQLEVEVGSDSLYNEAHVTVPLLIGTTGWGMFVQDRHPMVWDVASRQDDLVQMTVGLGPDGPDGLRFYLFTADHPLDVTHHYYEVTSPPLLPARWALGPWVWRDENEDQAQLMDDLQTMRDLDLATSGIWVDRPFANGVNSFDWNLAQFPDPQGMIDTAHDMGFRVALWQAPYADPEDAAEVHQQALDGGFFPPEHPIALNNWSVLIDLSNPDAFDWYQDLVRRYTDMGIEGFKLDYAEDVVTGLNGGRLPWTFWNGEDERTMHQGYKLLYHQVYAETLPADGGFLLSRVGTWGDQAWTSVIWPGDLDATMDPRYAPSDQHGEQYFATGGLPASVSLGLSLGPAGYPFYGADTGGYRHAPPDKETFTRWFEQTALSTVMQVGTNSNDVAWENTPLNGFDAEMLDWYRDYVRLHARLFPYEWTYAERLAFDGRPIQRALGLARPELGQHPADTYFFGDHLLVAPVVQRGATTRDVPFPPGRWVDWFTGEVFEGAQTVEAPLEKLPLFLAEGGIVPLLRPTIDTLAPASAKDVDAFGNDPGVLWARVFPGPGGGRFIVYDGATLTQDGDTLRSTDGDEFQQGVVWEIADRDAPAGVALDGDDLPELDVDALALTPGWAWDPARRLLSVRVPAGDHTVTLR